MKNKKHGKRYSVLFHVLNLYTFMCYTNLSNISSEEIIKILEQLKKKTIEIQQLIIFICKKNNDK